MNDSEPRQAQRASGVDHDTPERLQLISSPAIGNDGEPPGPPSLIIAGERPGC